MCHAAAEAKKANEVQATTNVGLPVTILDRQTVLNPLGISEISVRDGAHTHTHTDSEQLVKLLECSMSTTGSSALRVH